MFGNAPKAMWEQWATPDELNRITLCSRCLLVRDGERNILFETGIGAFFEPKYKERYGVIEAQHVLLDSLREAGLTHENIDVVVLSHLHFDHAGGLLAPYEEGEAKKLLFPNATFVVSAEAFERAENPHPRDRASFIAELPALLKESGRLEIVVDDSSETLGPDYLMHRSEGHTPGMMLAEIKTKSSSILFCADLIPGAAWVHLSITMGYDRFAEKVIDEKAELLPELLDRNAWLFFTHDESIACGKVAQNERGRFYAANQKEKLHNALL